MTTTHVDVLIVGAGLSGIAAAYYLQKQCAHKSYAILEGRGASGGTWDLFRYPGVRSDSDMFTLGYSFRLWPEAKSIADGPSILNYIRETAAAYGIDRQIRYQHRVRRAAWSSADAQWTVEVERGPAKEIVQVTCNFLFMCSGYYDYAQGYTPTWPGVDRFQGQIIHPQQWPSALDYSGKRVVVIGSGATAVTLVPAMAEQAAHVTMLQRSPTYMVSGPAQDAFADRLRKQLPARLAHSLARWKSILTSMYLYTAARRKPAEAKAMILQGIRSELGPGYDVDTHFSPRYNVWDQRVCLVPDADFFKAMKAGKVAVVTDQIATFTETGIQLQSGQHLEADIIVTATGLVMKLFSGVDLSVDGQPVALGQTMNYKGLMFSDIPNLAFVVGYTNASWTLKCELVCQYVCRLLNYMTRHNYTHCMPRRDPAVAEEPMLDFTSGYVKRALDQLPHQGSRRPWKLYQNYLLDLVTLRFGKVSDGIMVFVRSK